MQTVIFLTGVAGDGATTLKYANAHGPRFLTGYQATNKLTAATLRLPSYHDPFLPRTGGPNPRPFFRMSRSAFSLATSRRRRSISNCSGLICLRPGKAWPG
jgi:hypothetical protein